MDQRFAISNYPNTSNILNQLDQLIKKPIYTIKPEALKNYIENYFEKKCSKSKEMIEEAKNIIPGGVQHNLAFNHPFPLVFTKAQGAYLYDIDGNKYYDFLQAGGPYHGWSDQLAYGIRIPGSKWTQEGCCRWPWR